MHLILIEKNIRVGRHKNMFKIIGENKTLKTIPSSKLSHIIIFTQGFSISAEALSLASQQDIALTVCKPYGNSITFIQPIYNHPHIQNRWNQYTAIQNGLGIQIAKKIHTNKNRKPILIPVSIQNILSPNRRYTSQYYLPTHRKIKIHQH
ncbi:MAG: CRISPR-associated endonuclease Cas1 [Candidatus Hydrogenedens sp.]